MFGDVTPRLRTWFNLQAAASGQSLVANPLVPTGTSWVNNLLDPGSNGIVQRTGLYTTTAIGTTGSGNVVLATGATLVTPALGAATATSINGLTITTTTGTLTIASGKTATINNTLTFAGTDSTTITFQGTDTYVGRATTDTLTNKTYDTAGTGNVFKLSGTTVTTASSILDIFGSTQGDILYRGASGWVVLAPGTSGYVLTTAGASANPSWVAIPSPTLPLQTPSDPHAIVNNASAISIFATDSSGNPLLRNAGNGQIFGIDAHSNPILYNSGATATYQFLSGGTAQVTGGLVIDSPTGGSKGSGTINVATIYQNGTALAASATTDTTNAANISSGTLPTARMPALTGDVTSTVNTVTTVVGKINGAALGTTTATSGNILVASAGNAWTSVAMSGDATIVASGALTLATVNTNTGSFGSSTAIPTFTVNGKGLITAASTASVIAPAGTLSGTTLNSTVVSSSLTSVGTIGTGVWQGTVVGPTYGGTGVNNGSSTITLGGSLTFSGSFTTSITVTGNTTVTLPTSGTLLTGNQTITLSGDVTGSGATSISTTVAKINGASLGTTTATSGNILVASAGNAWTSVAMSGDATIVASGALTLATINSNTGSFGSSTAIPTFTVNAKGLITAASTAAVVAPAGTLSGTTLNSTVVSSSLTSVGTITSGTWTGTTIAIANGGTGQTSAANAINALLPSQTGNAGLFLTTNGTVASWSAAGAGNVTTTGSPSSGNLVAFSGSTSITNSNLSGDVTTSGTLVTTVAKINGATLGTTTATSGNILVASAGNAWTSVAMSGDATIVASGAISVAKTGGVAFAASATTDTTNASNISSGSLSLSRIATIAGSTLLGNPTGSSAVPSAITLGAGLVFSGSVLNTTSDSTIDLVSYTMFGGV